MINIAICEDDDKIVAKIEQCLLGVFSTAGKHYNLRVFNSYSTFAFNMADSEYAIVFLGTNVGGEVGLKFARKLRVQSNCEIIMVSDTARYALASYDINAFYYFVKPLDTDKCTFVLERLLSKIGDTDDKTVTLKRNLKYHTIRLSEIVSVSSDAHRIEITLKKGNTLDFGMKLDDFMALLDCTSPFIRIHKSHIVNAYYIKNMDIRQADVGGRLLSVSRAFKNEAIKAYAEYVKKR